MLLLVSWYFNGHFELFHLAEINTQIKSSYEDIEFTTVAMLILHFHWVLLSRQGKKMCKPRRMLFVRVVYDCNTTQSVSSEYPSALSISKMSAESNGYTWVYEGNVS